MRPWSPRNPIGNEIVSIHALLAECDIKKDRLAIVHDSFNPRTPCGVRLNGGTTLRNNRKFQSTHSLRSATHQRGNNPDNEKFQSTHSLRSATLANRFKDLHPEGFNPRTPCGVRQAIYDYATFFHMFQSTHSLRSATCILSAYHSMNMFQSTHSLRSATVEALTCGELGTVSIHALLAECDLGD